MSSRILRFSRPSSVAYLVVGVLIGAGGSYALAAGSTSTISVCADKGAGLLHLRTHGRCKRGQTRVSWNQVGPQGPQGRQGAPAVSIWGAEAANNNPIAQHGLSIQHVSAGRYQVTITAAACTHAVDNTPVVSIVDGNPPVGQSPGAFPVVWTTAVLPSGQFTVFTGVAVGGTFTSADDQFNVYDTC